MNNADKIERSYRLTRRKRSLQREKTLKDRQDSQLDLAYRPKTFRDGVSANSWQVISQGPVKEDFRKFRHTLNDFLGLNTEHKKAVARKTEIAIARLRDILATPICEDED